MIREASSERGGGQVSEREIFERTQGLLQQGAAARRRTDDV